MLINKFIKLQLPNIKENRFLFMIWLGIYFITEYNWNIKIILYIYIIFYNKKIKISLILSLFLTF